MQFNLVRVKQWPSGYIPPVKELANSYQLFCEFLRHLDGYGDSPYPDYKHYLLDQLDATRYDRDAADILIMEPRSHAKTTVDVIPYAPWRWLSEPYLRVGVYSAGERHSKKITRGIIRIVERLAEFGFYRIRDKKKQELTLWHNKPYIDPSLECYPIQGSSSVGSGKDIIIADDVYTTENASTEVKAAEVKVRYDSLTDLWREYEYPKRITIGTRLHTGDLYDDILRGTWGHRIFWFPIIPEKSRAGLPKIIENIEQADQIRKLCIWPDIIKAAKLRTRYNSPRAWHTQYMLQPADNAIPVFLRENILTTNKPANTTDFEYHKLAVYIDPAVGAANKHKGDNCAIIVGGVGKDGYWHVVDGWFGNDFVASDIEHAWKTLITRWCRSNHMGKMMFPKTVIEAAGQQALLLPPLKQAAMEEPIRGRVQISTQTTGNVKKELRIEGFLSPIVARRKLIIHESPVSKQLLTELVQFPGYRYRDLADATAAMVKSLAQFDPVWLGILRGESPGLL